MNVVTLEIVIPSFLSTHVRVSERCHSTSLILVLQLNIRKFDVKPLPEQVVDLRLVAPFTNIV